MIFYYLLVIFYFLHSLLLNNKLKNWLINALKLNNKLYRILFNVFNTVFASILAFLYFEIPSKLLFESKVLSFIGLLLIVVSLYGMYKSFDHYDTKVFIGLKEDNNATITSGNKLNISGLNSYVRHPLYTATTLLFIALVFVEFGEKQLIVLAISFIYELIGIKLEENKLIAKFGEEYIMYKNNVPMLIPKLKRYEREV